MPSVLQWLSIVALAASVGLYVWISRHNAAVQQARAANRAVGSLRGRQALVVGGTAGIGQALAVRLAEAGADVTIVGRNADAGVATVATMRGVNADGAFRFVRGDAMLMADAARAVSEFQKEVSRLDYVVFTQTKATLQGRTLTTEGIDEKLALNFYSRVYITRLLAPLLQRTAALPGADVRVLSVLAAGVHPAYAHFQEDPYLVDHYSGAQAANAGTFYNDLWADKASRLYPGVTFAHANPGFVASSWGTDMPAALRFLIRGIQLTPLAKSTADCAELLLPALIAPELKGGFRLLGEHANIVSTTDLHNPQSVETVFEQTSRLLTSATGRKFD